jgi:2,3-dihydroxybenzoate decarboxylase
MHNPTQAVRELTRAVKVLGFHGVLVNNWQHAVDAKGEDKLLLYDGPEYDVFWSALEELDVPLYLHPSKPEGKIYDLIYKDRPYLQGPPQSFAIDVSTHVLGLISNGSCSNFTLPVSRC